MRNKFKNKNVVITGGSSGIGFSIAVEFAKLDAHLFLIARNQYKLDEAKKQLIEKFPDIRVDCFPADVSDWNQIDNAIQTIGTQYGGIHTLISNAGMMSCGRMTEQSIATFQEMMEDPSQYFLCLHHHRLVLHSVSLPLFQFQQKRILYDHQLLELLYMYNSL